MTPDEIEKDRAPERIWSSLDSFGFRKSVSPYSQTLAKSTEYVRSDLFDALTAENARLKERVAELEALIAGPIPDSISRRCGAMRGQSGAGAQPRAADKNRKE